MDFAKRNRFWGFLDVSSSDSIRRFESVVLFKIHREMSPTQSNMWRRLDIFLIFLILKMLNKVWRRLWIKKSLYRNLGWYIFLDSVKRNLAKMLIFSEKGRKLRYPPLSQKVSNFLMVHVASIKKNVKVSGIKYQTISNTNFVSFCQFSGNLTRL